MRTRFHSRYSYPPRIWRDTGWQCVACGWYWIVATGIDNRYKLWYVHISNSKEWPHEIDCDNRNSNPVFVATDDGGIDPFDVDASRVFNNKQDATIEANNLNEWLERMNMGKKWPHEEVSEVGAVLPEGLYTVKVIDAAEGESRNGNYQLVFKTRIVEPRAHRNAPYKIQFTIGNEADPEADEPETWTASFAASRYKGFLKAADVPETGDIDEELEAATGQTLILDNGHDASGKYNDPKAFYRVGERDDDKPVRATKKEVKPIAKTERVQKVSRKNEEVAQDDAESGGWEED